MKVSYNWLKKYLDFSLSIQEVDDILTKTGLEVESVLPIGSVEGNLEGIVVGERGPEIVTPNEVIPNYELGGSKNMNLTFNVSALDGASVQEVLTNNQGAVVGAIRDAANSYGQDFLPDVNVGYMER